MLGWMGLARLGLFWSAVTLSIAQAQTLELRNSEGLRIAIDRNDRDPALIVEVTDRTTNVVPRSCSPSV
jgi:hypothetical protein